MASSSTALLLLLSLLFFTMSNGQGGALCTQCTDLVRNLLQPISPLTCCAALNGLTNLEAAGCLCDLIKAQTTGPFPITINVPATFSAIIATCGIQVPVSVQCQ